MAPSSDQLPKCAACEAATLSNETRDSVAQLSEDDLRAYEPRVERIDIGGVRHAVEISGLVGEYDLERARRCSYFNHSHKRGLLVWTPCGRLLSLGLVCGRKNVAGFGRLEREMEIARAIMLERELQLTEPARLLSGLRAVQVEAGRRIEGEAALERHALELHRAMRRAYQYNDLVVEIRVRRFDPKLLRHVDDFTHPKLVGLQLFGGALSARKLQDLVDRAAVFEEQMATTTIDRGNYAQVQQARLALRKELKCVFELLDETARFWTTANLALAVRKAFGKPRTETVEPDGHTIRVAAGDVTWVLGIDGATQE